MVMVIKLNGKIRVCIDFCDLNCVFFLKIVKEVLVKMFGVKIFSNQMLYLDVGRFNQMLRV